MLIDYARDVVGMPCKGQRGGVHVGWTRDAEKAEKMRAAGARVETAPQSDGVGYEVSFGVGAEAA
jgi:hypothetical protein